MAEESPAIFPVELHKRFLFNMMDGELAQDFLLALDTAHTCEVAQFATRTVAVSSLVLQGLG